MLNTAIESLYSVVTETKKVWTENNYFSLFYRNELKCVN